jgi:chorismate-pyruvate lyase
MWVKNLASLAVSPDSKFTQWLQTPNNLAAAMRKVCNELTLQLVEQKLQIAYENEISFFAMQKSFTHAPNYFVRKIILLGDGVPFSYGRVVIPETVYLKHEAGFANLGTKLIGETMLYNNPATQRSHFEFAHLGNMTDLTLEIKQAMQKVNFNLAIDWARRSMFLINGVDPILITEAFCSTIPARVL